MEDYPFVSIIILSYNGVSYLENCLVSVLNLCYPRDRYEIIVADNGSTDNSVSLLKSNFENEIILHEFGTNHGFAKGNNLAVNYAKGELLAFLNQDTVIERKWLSDLVKGIEKGFDACHSNMLLPRNVEFANLYNKKLPEKFYYYEINKFGYVEQIIKDYSNKIVETEFISGASFIIKKTVLEELGYLFDESLGTYNEDMDLGFRLTKNGYKIGAVPSSVVYHLSSFSFKFNKYNVWKNHVIIRNRYLAFWKKLNLRKFLQFLPYLIISQSHKVFTRSIELKNGYARSIMLATVFLPLSFISLLSFISTLLRKSMKE